MKKNILFLLANLIFVSCVIPKNSINDIDETIDEPTSFYFYPNYSLPPIEYANFSGIDSNYKYLENIEMGAKKVIFLKDTLTNFFKEDTVIAHTYKIIADVYVQTMCNGAGMETEWENLEAEYILSVVEDKSKIYLNTFINLALVDLGRYPRKTQLFDIEEYFAFWFDEELVLFGRPVGEAKGCYALLLFDDKLYKIQFIKGGALGSVSSFYHHNLRLKIKGSVCNLFNEDIIEHRPLLDSLKMSIIK